MKTLCTFLLLVFILQSCKKEIYGTGKLAGKWKLTKVYDNMRSATVDRPENSGKDFTMSFYSDSTFSAISFRNTYSNGRCTLTNDDELRFGTYNSSKAIEDGWGHCFVSVLNSCVIQSLYPCTPSLITITGNKLIIKTPNSFDLTLEKIP